MEIDEVTKRIIGCAADIHRALGPGQYEYSYAAALDVAFREDGLRFRRDASFPVRYRGRTIGSLRPDFIVEDAVVLELKPADWLPAEARAQILCCLRATGRTAGLLIDFRTHPLKRGIRRFSLAKEGP